MGTFGWALQAKEERLAEEKAKKKAAAKKMEEVEARRKQEEEARRLRWLQQVRGQVGKARASGRVGRARMCLSPRGWSWWPLWLQARRRFHKCFGDTDGDSNLPPVFCRGDSLGG